MATEPPRPLCSLAEIMSARHHQQSGGEISYTNCRCLTQFPGMDNTFWISSPNMDFIPKPPIHLTNKPFSYHSDGMLGPFKHMKWPQAYYEREPHTMAAPLNPILLARNLSEREMLSPHSSLDDFASLPRFNDEDIPWCSFTPDDFEVKLQLPSATVGTLKESILSRLRQSMIEIKAMAGQAGQNLLSSGPDDPRPQHLLRTYAASVLYHKQRLDCLYRVYFNLTQVPMSTFDTVLWFREFQRILLDLRAWTIYTLIVQSRWDAFWHNRPGIQPALLPVRGVITANATLVEQMFRIGVPVWYVRQQYTLTSNTLIVNVKTVVKSGICFSSTRRMRHGAHWSDAPFWIDAVHEDRTNMQEIIRRFSLTSRPCLHPLQEYSPENVTVFELARARRIASSNQTIMADTSHTEHKVNHDDTHKPLSSKSHDRPLSERIGSHANDLYGELPAILTCLS